MSKATLEAAHAAIGDDRMPAVEMRSSAGRLRSAALVCAALVAVLGVGVLAGWAFNIEPLMTLLPGFIRMTVNAAICFVILGVALALTQLAPGNLQVQRSPGRWAASLAWLALAIGSATLLEYGLGLDLHIDQLLFHDAQAKVYPGRMASISAICFCLAAASLILQGSGKRFRRFAALPALLLELAAFSAIVGYLYGVPVLYGSITNAAMALHTGVGFLVLGAGLVLAQPEYGLSRMLAEDATGGLLARRLLPAAILVPIILGRIYLQPALNFGDTRFSVALLAMTLTVSCTAGLWFLAKFLNRAERQQAEFLLRQEESAALIRHSERELRLVTDSLPILLSYIDVAGRFVRVNRTYEQWTGLESHQVVGRTIRELLGESYFVRTEHARDAVRRGETITFETAYPTVLGELQAQVTYTPDIDENGFMRGIVCMVLDVDEYRRTEAALRQSEKLAVVGRMASSIAHEINNPLEAVTNLLFLVGSSLEPLTEAAEYVAMAQEQLRRVSHIVVETLRFHRQASHPTLCRVSDVIEQVLVLHQGRLAHAGIQVERRFRDETLLLCRDGEIRQVLANLVGNAADAMSSGGRLLVRTHQACHPRSGARGISIVIADTGHGIDARTRQKLFEPFHTTKGETGSGLGLWISKELVERHGGSLSVRSLVAAPAASLVSASSSGRSGGQETLSDCGTVFRIFLPHSMAGEAAHP